MLLHQAELAQNSVTATQIPSGTITADLMGANSVDSVNLLDGSIDTSHIGSQQVTTAKIANLGYYSKNSCRCSMEQKLQPQLR